MPLGAVTAAFGRQFYVSGDDGASLVCVMRGKRNDAAVGDRVRYGATGGGVGVIDEVLARHTVLRRSDRRRTKLFAANLSQVAIVIAPDPAPSEALIMRALIAAHEAGLPAAIVLNKVDLAPAPAGAGQGGAGQLLEADMGAADAGPGTPVETDTAGAAMEVVDTATGTALTIQAGPDAENPAHRRDAPSVPTAIGDSAAQAVERRREVLRRVALYESLGVPVMRVAAGQAPQAARDTLLPWLVGQVTLLLGQSGMGKSTLVNLLVPDAAMATRAISEALGTGRHTTTFARAFALAEGGSIIDSPGFQEFGLEHLSLSQVQAAMPEFAPHLGGCRFNNCTHRAEPGCAVRAAVAARAIDARRHALYTQLADELMRPLH